MEAKTPCQERKEEGERALEKSALAVTDGVLFFFVPPTPPPALPFVSLPIPAP
jgi:hypothetical protein